VAGGFVRVDKTLTRTAVDDRNSGFIGSFRLSFIAHGDGFKHLFDVSAQRGALASIKLAVFFGLTGAFSRLSRVGQSVTPKNET
jgi:hypothetical protein